MTLYFPFLSSCTRIPAVEFRQIIERRNVVQAMIAFCSIVYITRHKKPCSEFKGRYTRNSLILEIIQKGNPITLDRKVALFLFQPVSFSLSKNCFPWNLLKIYRHSGTFRVNTVACYSIRKFYEDRYDAATERSPFSGEDDGVGGIRCLLLLCCPHISRQSVHVVYRKGYRVVITSKTDVHGTEYGGNYAERRNITAQVRCECDRFMGLCSTTWVSARYFIGLADILVEGAAAQVLYFSAQCVIICKCRKSEI